MQIRLKPDITDRYRFIRHFGESNFFSTKSEKKSFQMYYALVKQFGKENIQN